ncbi:MAG: nucleoside-diphosphate kinase, partial [Patescibacteria group bacterium]
MEKTLIVMKPDAVVRGVVGEIVTRFEKVGLKIVAAKMLVPDDDLISQHYPVDRKEFITGLGQKTLDNNKELGVDTKAVFGTDDPHELGLHI